MPYPQVCFVSTGAKSLGGFLASVEAWILDGSDAVSFAVQCAGQKG
jgi:hypothetical protein